MPPRGFFSSASGGGGGGVTTASNKTIGTAEPAYPQPVGSVGVIADNAASAGMIGVTGGLRSVDVTFPTGFLGGNITFTAPDRFGNSQSETYIKGSNVTRVGTKIFRMDGTGTFTNAAPAGSGATSASASYGTKIGVSHAPVASFESVEDLLAGGVLSVASSDLTNGWVIMTELPTSLIVIRYTFVHTHTLS
jgi:hypothetical protein